MKRTNAKPGLCFYFEGVLPSGNSSDPVTISFSGFPPSLFIATISTLKISLQKSAEILRKTDSLECRSFFSGLENFGIKAGLNIHCIFTC